MTRATDDVHHQRGVPRGPSGVSAVLSASWTAIWDSPDGGPDFDCPAGMYCRSCESPRRPAHPGPIWGADRISGLRCDGCGALLGAEDVARLLLAKQSQLEQFGMLKPPSEAGAPGRALHLLRSEND